MTRQAESGDLADLYREVILDHNKRPRNFGSLPEPSRSAHGDNPLCGDTVTVHLGLADERIAEVAWQGQGCAISQAAASMMTDAVQGLTVAEARRLAERFREAMTGVTGVTGMTGSDTPGLEGKLAVFAGVRDYPMRVKCATLAWHTLKAALESGATQSSVTTEQETSRP
jgi:nitrogen fixation NifU-like protein